MASTNVNLNSKAYKALLSAKTKGESFSDVVLRYVRPKPKTCRELLEELERDFDGLRIFDPDPMRQMKAGRDRRSNRRVSKRQ